VWRVASDESRDLNGLLIQGFSGRGSGSRNYHTHISDSFHFCDTTSPEFDHTLVIKFWTDLEWAYVYR
jgi:hypothetical protein